MPAEEAERVTKIFSHIAQQQKSFNNLENMNLHKDGHLVTLETSGVPFFDKNNNFCGYRGIDRDISNRKQAEAAHALNEQRLLEAQRIAQMGHWNWNIQEQKLYWSDEVYRIFDLQPNECTPTFETLMKTIHPNDRDMLEQAIDEALVKNNYSIDHRILLPDGKVRVLHVQGKVYYDKAGQAVQMFGTTQDITERKYLEDALNTTSQLRPYG